VDLLGAPAAGDHLALEHLEQQAGAAPGGVLLLAGHHVARAHRAAALAAALANSHAAQGGVGEALLVGREPEGGGQPQRRVAGAEAQVLVQPVGVDQLARVHPALRVPDRLELGEGGHQLGAEHPGQQLGPGLAVAVLARQRPAVAHHQVGGLLDVGPEAGHALLGLQVEVVAGVHAALPDVAVERAVVAVAVQQPAQVA
jgi:hypothetical protein